MPVPVKETMRKMYLFPILWIVIKKNIEIKNTSSTVKKEIMKYPELKVHTYLIINN